MSDFVCSLVCASVVSGCIVTFSVALDVEWTTYAASVECVHTTSWLAARWNSLVNVDFVKSYLKQPMGFEMPCNLHANMCADYVEMLARLSWPNAGINLLRLPALQVLHMREHCFRGSLNCDTLRSLELTCDPSIARHVDSSRAAADLFANLAGLQTLRLQLLRPTLHVSLHLAELPAIINTFVVVCLDGHYCRLSCFEAHNWYWFMQFVCASCSLYLDWSPHLIQAKIWKFGAGNVAAINACVLEWCFGS